jgi:MHS family proline/betaine transporter-like MFS transporter
MNSTKSNLKNFTIDQAESVGILSFGTLLEYFDLMLYIHMAVILNDLFFPKTDPFTAQLLSAFAFCSSFIFRPLGGLFFGYIGDKIGRKNSVFLTIMLMSGTCFTMFLLPEYSKIGIWASIIMILCRILQGMSSLGETVGAQLYISETIKTPAAYPMVVIINIAGSIGSGLALLVGSTVLNLTDNWRYIFLFGSFIALVGVVFRVRLRESVEFADAAKRLDRDQMIEEPLNRKLLFSYFFMKCITPLFSYLAFIFMPILLKKQGLKIYDILSQNLFVTVLDISIAIGFAYCSYKLHPLKILRFLSSIFLPIMCIIIYFLSSDITPSIIFIFQIIAVCVWINTVPAEPIIYKNFPVFKRFRAVSIPFALATAFIKVLSSFGVELLVNKFGILGLYFLVIPFSLAYVWGLNNFIKIEKEKGTYILLNSKSNLN